MHGDVLSAWKDKLGKGLRALDQQHQRRSLLEVRGINFCSNDYLGLAVHPALREAVVRAAQCRLPRVFDSLRQNHSGVSARIGPGGSP